MRRRPSPSPAWRERFFASAAREERLLTPVDGVNSRVTISGEGMRIGIVGTGTVGLRLARELVDDPIVETVALLSGSGTRQAQIHDALGDKVLLGGADIDQSGVDAVVLCTPDEAQYEFAAASVRGGRHVVALADSIPSVRALLSLDGLARDSGCSVVVGAAMSPGLSSLLAVHAASLYDSIEAISIGVTGAAGPSCSERTARAQREDAVEWADGWVTQDAKSGSDLLWFPDPVGAMDCVRGDLSEAVLLHRRLPDAQQISVRVGRTPIRRGRPWRRDAKIEELGGVRVEVRGLIDESPVTTVYGLVDRPSVASATLSAICVRSVVAAGALGAGGVTEFIEPLPTLSMLAARGVKTAVYEGVD